MNGTEGRAIVQDRASCNIAWDRLLSPQHTVFCNGNHAQLGGKSCNILIFLRDPETEIDIKLVVTLLTVMHEVRGS